MSKPSEGKRTRLMLVTGASILVADQVSKVFAERWLAAQDAVSVIPGLLQFTLVRNTGMAFGFMNDVDFPGKNWVLAGVSLALLIVILALAARPGPGTLLSAAGLSAMASGAFGNILDRLRHGYVVDFIDAYVGAAHWPVFNIADAAICTGVGLLLLDGVSEFRRSRSEAAG